MSSPERIAVGHNVSIYQRGKRKTWSADFWREGEHCRQSLKTSNKKVALQRAMTLSAAMGNGTYAKLPSPIAVSKAIDDYMAFLQTKHRARKTIVKYRSTLALLVAFLAENGITKLGHLTESHFDKFRAARLVGHHPKTVYSESVIVKQLTKWAKKRRLIRENPLAEYELDKPAHEEGACPNLDEVNQILGDLDGQRRIQVEILSFSGIRSSELRRLTAEDIDLVGRWIHVRSRTGSETKNRKSRKIPIHDRLLPALQNLALRGQRWLFTERASKKYPNGDHEINGKRLNEDFQTTAKRLGMVVGRKRGGLVAHSLRHFFETACVNAGVPQRVVDNWMGHAPDRSAASFYYKLGDEESQTFIKRVPFHNGKPALLGNKED